MFIPVNTDIEESANQPILLYQSTYPLISRAKNNNNENRIWLRF